MISFFRRSFPLLVLGALAASCASGEQLAQRDNERCAAQGLQPNTQAFSDCVIRFESGRQLRTDARRLEMLEKSSNPLPR